MQLGTDVNVVWIASVPRTGSMWTYNIVRDLVRSTGRQPRPEIVPSTDAEMETIGHAGIAADDGVYVVKVHTRIPTDLAKSFYVVTHRDVRDSVVSFMRFTQGDFDAGLRFVAAAIRLDRHFSTFPAEHRLDLDYADILLRPEWIIEQLAQRLDIAVDPALPAELVARYSKENVQSRLVEREKALREKIASGQPVDRRDFVAAPNRAMRAFDTATGFQSGHVSAYREGDWKHILTADQQTQIGELQAYVLAQLADKTK